MVRYSRKPVGTHSTCAADEDVQTSSPCSDVGTMCAALISLEDKTARNSIQMMWSISILGNLRATPNGFVIGFSLGPMCKDHHIEGCHEGLWTLRSAQYSLRVCSLIVSGPNPVYSCNAVVEVVNAYDEDASYRKLDNSPPHPEGMPTVEGLLNIWMEAVALSCNAVNLVLQSINIGGV